MKNFNQEIQVTVSVNSIANNLLDTMSPEFKHREQVVETLIGRMLSSDMTGLSMLYNSLNGYTQEIDFVVGEEIEPTNLSKYSYWGQLNDAGERMRTERTIDRALIKSIDLYADKKIEIEYTSYDSRGNAVETTEWINHTRCNKVTQQVICI